MKLERSAINTILTLILAVITLATVVLTVPNNLTRVPELGFEWFVYVFLTGFALLFGIRLTQGELSISHAIGMVGFLSLPVDAYPIILWAQLIGAICGSALLVLRGRWRMNNDYRASESLHILVFVPARVILSFYAASRIYIASSAPLPIEPFQGINIWNNISAILIYSFTYTSVYFSIFALQLYIDEHPILPTLRDNLLYILTILWFPVPFAALGAEIVHRHNSTTSFTMVATGILFTIIGLYNLSRSQHRLHKQIDEMRSLSVVTQSMRGHLNLDTLLRTTYLQIANLLEIDGFLVALYSEDGTRLHYPFILQRGQEIEGQALSYKPNDLPLIECVLNQRNPLLLSNNVRQGALDLGIQPPSDNITSWLGAPLLAGQRVLGAFIVTTHDPRNSFDTDDLRLLNIVAASASIAIDNAQLYAQKSARAEQLATLSKIAALLTGSLSPDTILDIVISSASTISDATGIAVFILWDQEEGVLSLARHAGLSERFTQRAPTPLLTQDIAPGKNPQPILIKDVATAPQAEPYRQLLASENKNAFLELPLTIGPENLGVISLFFDLPQVFSGEQVDIYQAFATQAAQAIRNARLYKSTDTALERHVEQLFALSAMGRLLVTTQTHHAYDLILSYASDATKASRAAMILYDEEQDALTMASQRGYPPDTFNSIDILRQGLTGQVLSNRQPIRVTDVRKKTAYLPIIPSTRSLMIVPVMKGGLLIGLIMLENDATNAFSEEDGHFVAQVANQAVIALDNAKLFQTINEAYNRQQVILNAMHEAVILINTEQQIVLANPAVDLIGFSPMQLMDKTVDELLDDKRLDFAVALGFTRNENLRHLLNEMNNAHTWDNQRLHLYEAHSEKGIRYVQRQTNPVRDALGKIVGIILVFYNKTEEHELERAREILSQMIIHDLRSPLTAVTTSMKLLNDLVPTDSDIKSAVTNITDSGRRAIRKVLSRVDSLLDISKMESGELRLQREPTELATLADSVCVELSPLAHDIEVKVASDIGDDLPMLDIDADKVERMLLNLVDNALKYSPPESEIRLRAFKGDNNGKRVPDGFVRLDVIDCGPGIPNEYKTRLFDRFVQVEGRQVVRRGVGLGLTFCRMVAETHGGKIWVEDNPNGGSIFSVTLPIAQP